MKEAEPQNPLKVITVSWDEDLEVIAAILEKKRIKKLPIERNGVLAGIISRGDVIRHSFKIYCNQFLTEKEYRHGIYQVYRIDRIDRSNG